MKNRNGARERKIPKIWRNTLEKKANKKEGGVNREIHGLEFCTPRHRDAMGTSPVHHWGVHTVLLPTHTRGRHKSKFCPVELTRHSRERKNAMRRTNRGRAVNGSRCPAMGVEKTKNQLGWARLKGVDEPIKNETSSP